MLRRLFVQAQARPWRAVAAALCWSALLSMVAVVMAPWFHDLGTYGFHDWDVETSFRYLVTLSLLEHGELPGWNPYACGGYPSWGYVEGATNLVSPWLPIYLLAPLPVAIRLEAAGMGVLGAVGAYLWAGRFTKSYGARLLVVALWAVNGRWGLQTASGHTWHLAYAYLPWCGFFFERLRSDPRSLGDKVGLAVGFAMLVYSGGIYPLPHTVLALGVYAALLALEQRRLGPLVSLAQGGLLGIALSAPKLLPMLDTFATDPRLIESTESLSLGAFVTLLTSTDQRFYSRPAKVWPYGWHEWGMYISVFGAGLLAAGMLWLDTRRERALKLTGLLFLVLGFGAFHPWAPWPLLHRFVPVFRSQHVPSRFLYPAVLLLALVLAAGVGRAVDRRRFTWPWLDLLLTLAAGALAIDVARVAQLPMKDAMWMVAPPIERRAEFHFEEHPPYDYVRRDWAPPLLLSMMANTGVLDCYGVPRGEDWQPRARSHLSPDYRGEVYLEDGLGRANLEAWSPNRVRVALEGVTGETRLVYNMHHFRGWHATVDGEARPVVPSAGLVSVPVAAGSRRVELWYRPPGLFLGGGVLVTTAVGLAWTWRRRRREGAS